MRFFWFKTASFLTTNGNVTESIDGKDVIVATNFTSVPRADSVHSNSSSEAVSVYSDSSSQAVSIQLNSSSQGLCHFINIGGFSILNKHIRVPCWVKRFLRNLKTGLALCEGFYGDALVEKMKKLH